VIAVIEGILLHAGREAVIVVAGGAVGLEVHLSERGAARLPAHGESVRLWTHLSVREDAWTLYGFIDQRERAMFRLLTTVSGVGPRLALGMLSAAEPQQIARYLETGDERGLARLPGIGKKSAARLVVELGKRIPAMLNEASIGDQTNGGGGPIKAHDEAVKALLALGLPDALAENLLRQAGRDDPALTDDASSWVRAALSRLETPGR
jgi:holliday junction DNA helicase RuvA